MMVIREHKRMFVNSLFGASGMISASVLNIQAPSSSFNMPEIQGLLLPSFVLGCLNGVLAILFLVMFPSFL